MRMFKYREKEAIKNLDDAPEDGFFKVYYPLYIKYKKEKGNMPWTYKIIDLLDYQRYLLIVRTDVYPLMWIYWKFINSLFYLQWRIEGKVYWFLRNQLNGGIDFIPDTEIVGGWDRLIKQFIKYKYDRSRMP